MSSKAINGDVVKQNKGKKSYSNKKANKKTSNIKRQSKESEFLNEAESFQSSVVYSKNDESISEEEEEEEENSDQDEQVEENFKELSVVKKLPFDMGIYFVY